MTALAAMDKPSLSIGLIKPSPKIVDQYFNTSTGAGDEGEEDLIAPWNKGDGVERVDAPAFQEIADAKLGTRKASPIDGPELGAPTGEADRPVQAEHAGEDGKRARGRREHAR